MRAHVILIACVVCAGGVAWASEGTAVYPGREWAVKPAGEVGLTSQGLNAFSDYTRGFGCVVRHGYLVYAWGDPSRRMDVASAAKPVYAHFLLKAVEDERITYSAGLPPCHQVGIQGGISRCGSEAALVHLSGNTYAYPSGLPPCPQGGIKGGYQGVAAKLL